MIWRTLIFRAFILIMNLILTLGLQVTQAEENTLALIRAVLPAKARSLSAPSAQIDEVLSAYNAKIAEGKDGATLENTHQFRLDIRTREGRLTSATFAWSPFRAKSKAEAALVDLSLKKIDVTHVQLNTPSGSKTYVLKDAAPSVDLELYFGDRQVGVRLTKIIFNPGFYR